MSQRELDEEYGPVGAPQEDLTVEPAYDDTTPDTVSRRPATPQIEELPADAEEDQE